MNKSKLTAVQRIEVTSSRINEGNILKSVLQSDMEKIKATLEEIDQESFNNIVKSILNARRYTFSGKEFCSSCKFSGLLLQPDI